MTKSFKPIFTITNRITAGLTFVESYFSDITTIFRAEE